MTEAGMEIYLDEFVVEVGESLTGRIVRHPDSDGITTTSKVREIRLSLKYETSGRGTTDSSAVSTQNFACDSHGGVNGSFSLSVPGAGPISYDGNLIRVRWQVEARLDVKMARDPKLLADVLVVPRNGFAVYDRPHPLRRQ